MNLNERKLTSKARKALPKGDFVFKKDRRYPIHDKSHARNALSRVSQHGTPAEKAKVRAAVHRRYPEIGKGKKTDESIARICGRTEPLNEGQGKPLSIAEQMVVILLSPPETGTCEKCGATEQELRPFGENGAKICFKCGMADEQGTSKRFLDLFHNAEQEAEKDMVAREAAANAMGYEYLSKPNVNG